MKFMLVFMFMQIIICEAMSYGKVFPTRLQAKTLQGTSIYVVKDISELSEFADLVSYVDDTRRFLELREGINEAKIKHFTFKCICGPTNASVFGCK